MCPAPHLSRPVTPQSPAPWMATPTTPAWPTWEARPLSSMALQPTRLMLVSGSVHLYNVFAPLPFNFRSSTLPTYTISTFRLTDESSTMHSHTNAYWTAHAQNACGQKVKVSDVLCGDSPMGLSVTASSKTITNSRLIAPFCPPSISSLLPRVPFIWQPHLFSLCWLIASHFHLAERKDQKKKQRGREEWSHVERSEIFLFEKSKLEDWNHLVTLPMKFILSHMQ